MKNKMFSKLVHTANLEMLLELTPLQLESADFEIEPILRWEDDGGLVIDAVIPRSNRRTYHPSPIYFT